MTPQQRTKFDRLFTFSLDTGTLRLPETMRPWAAKQFGIPEKVERQPILKITNTVTCEGALFNKLRAERPMRTGTPVKKEELLALAAKEPFAHIAEQTPEDEVGRIVSASCVTAGNVAKFDALHGLVVFKNPDPLSFTEQETVDHLQTAMAWLRAAANKDPAGNYPLIGWNCLWKAGASLVHGHLQVLLGKHAPYGAPLHLRESAERYKKRYRRSYWQDLFAAHELLGLAVERNGVKVLAHITPRKEKELLFIADAADERLFRALHRVLRALIDKLGVESFNVVLLFPPLDGTWRGFPVIARIVDRGSLAAQTTDLAFMELYAGHSVVSSDPVKVWAVVKDAL